MRKRKPANMVSQINLSIDHEDVLDDEDNFNSNPNREKFTNDYSFF